MTKMFAVLVAAVLLTACGGSNPNGPDPTPFTPPTPGATIKVVGVTPAQGTLMPWCCELSVPGAMPEVSVKYTIVGDYNGYLMVYSSLSVDGVTKIVSGSTGKGVVLNGLHGSKDETISHKPSIGVSDITQTDFVISELRHYPNGMPRSWEESEAGIVLARDVYPWVFKWPGQ